MKDCCMSTVCTSIQISLQINAQTTWMHKVFSKQKQVSGNAELKEIYLQKTKLLHQTNCTSKLPVKNGLGNFFLRFFFSAMLRCLGRKSRMKIPGSRRFIQNDFNVFLMNLNKTVSFKQQAVLWNGINNQEAVGDEQWGCVQDASKLAGTPCFLHSGSLFPPRPLDTAGEETPCTEAPSCPPTPSNPHPYSSQVQPGPET